MYVHNLNPILLDLGLVQIRWYGVIYVLGFIAGFYFINYLAKRRHVSLSEDDVADFLVYLIIGTLIGARIFYIVFFNIGYYIDNPLSVFALWQGGLSFHGGLVGSVISGFLFCKKKKIEFYDIGDIVVVPLAFGLIFGRIANFINGELVGRVTNVNWCVEFKGYEGCRHPSQLYESFKNVIIFTTLWVIKDKKYPKGTFFWLFIIMYGVLRFLIEFVRTPDAIFGLIYFGITMGQVFNLIMVVVGGYMMWKGFRKTLN